MRSVLVSISVSLVLLSCALAGGAAAQDKLLPVDGVNFAVGSATDVFIPGTTSDPATEEAVVPVSLRGIAGSAPDSVKVVLLKIAYPADQLAYLGGSLDDFGAIPPGDEVWQGDALFSEENGVVTVILDSDTVETPEDFLAFCYLKFAPLCQESAATAVVTVMTGPGESYVSYHDVHYTDPTVPEPSGGIVVAEYAGYVSVLDPDPFDAEPVTLDVGGAVDADLIIDVPVYLSTNANVWRLRGYMPYDETRLEPVGYVPGNDCNIWDWSYGSPPIPNNGIILLDLANYPFSNHDTGEPCTVVTVSFRMVGDWRGQTETLEFVPYGGGALVGNSYDDECTALSPIYTYHPGLVTMEDYAATVALQLDDMIYAADAGTNKGFEAVIAASHNFTIGGDDAAYDPDAAALRLDLDLALGVSLLGHDHPDSTAPDPTEPLNDFWFEVNGSSAKSLRKLEFYSSLKYGVPGVRAPTAELTPLVKMDLQLTDVVAPADFDAPDYPLVLQCLFDDREARLRDAITDLIQVDCGDGMFLELEPLPALAYANGELSCDQSTSTRPADVVQPYYLRSTFPVTDFRVTVVESGPHAIVDVTPAAGVVVLDQGTSYVTFGPGPDWEPVVCADRHMLGAIKYSTSTSIPHDVFDKSLEKDVAPPITWCWRWTDISFGGDSYVRDATDQETFLFTATGRVGTRYDCSVIANPSDPSLPNKSVPATFALSGNHPNPFNPETIISFNVPYQTAVSLVIHDLQGRRVAVLVDDVRPAGRHQVVWTGRDQSGRPVSSGLYFYTMQAGDFSERRKMVLLK